MLWNDKTKGVNTNILNTTGIYLYFIFCLKGILCSKIEFTVYRNMHIRKTKMHGILFVLKTFLLKKFAIIQNKTLFM